MWSLHINNPVETYSDRSYPGWGPHLVVFFSTATFLLLGPNSLVCCLHVNSYYMWVLYTTCHSILLNIPQLCYSFVYITLILAYISWGKYTSMGVERFLSSFSFSLIRSIHYFKTNFHKQNRLTRKIISVHLHFLRWWIVSQLEWVKDKLWCFGFIAIEGIKMDGTKKGYISFWCTKQCRDK